MAAAANKPGALHYALVAFVFLSAILGFSTYSSIRELHDQAAKMAEAKDTSEKKNQAFQKEVDKVQTLRKLYGSKFEEISDPSNPLNPATVAGSMATDLQTYGKDAAAATVQETLRRLRENFDALAADRDSKAVTIARLEKEISALSGQYQAKVDTYSASSTAHEQEKLSTIGDRDEKLNAKNQKIQELSSLIQTTRLELSEEKDGREKERREANFKATQLEGRIAFLSDKIDNLEKLSFEVAKGLITNVEHSSNTVLINVGEDDFLRARMTFSVYAKENQGVGRGADDIKGKIEVIKIIGPHMAVAKVIDEDIYRPIVAQDLIYTPIWSPGLIEKISIIGDIDLDQDGRGDREQFHQMMATAGCVIDNEVNDNGDRIPADGKITVQTRFLVKGEIPSLLDAQTDEEKARAERFKTEFKKMEDEARTNGVRVIKLNDFLAYVGFHNKRRTFLPGQNRKFQLKSGNPNTGGTSVSIDRASNGAVSGLFKKGRKGPQDTSAGATSGATGE